ncbi:MAG: DNA polymerase III subunit delta', partial [Propionicimonas sp.]
DCLSAAAKVVQAASEEAAAITSELDAKEREALAEALGMGTRGARPRSAQAALGALEDEQKLRAKRLQRDALDRVLTEFTSYYRDVLVLQTGAGAPLINVEFEAPIRDLAERSAATATVRRLDAILACRTALETNVAPLLAMEALMIGLADHGQH